MEAARLDVAADDSFLYPMWPGANEELRQSEENDIYVGDWCEVWRRRRAKDDESFGSSSTAPTPAQLRNVWRSKARAAKNAQASCRMAEERLAQPPQYVRTVPLQSRVTTTFHIDSAQFTCFVMKELGSGLTESVVNAGHGCE